MDSSKQQLPKVKSQDEVDARLRALSQRAQNSKAVSAPSANGTVAIGTTMADGTIYAGQSPTTHRPMYVVPKDADLRMTFYEAAKYAKGLKIGDKQDFRVPDVAELQVLFDNKDKGDLKGTFNDEVGSYSAGFYWSSKTVYADSAWAQRFRDGLRCECFKNYRLLVRCVR